MFSGSMGSVIAALRLWFASGRLAHERALADHLVSNGARFAMSDYWTAYYLSFLTDEQVIVASHSHARILEYQDVVAERADEAFRIGLSPCSDGHQVQAFHVCPPPP